MTPIGRKKCKISRSLTVVSVLNEHSHEGGGIPIFIHYEVMIAMMGRMMLG